MGAFNTPGFKNLHALSHRGAILSASIADRTQDNTACHFFFFALSGYKHLFLILRGWGIHFGLKMEIKNRGSDSNQLSLSSAVDPSIYKTMTSVPFQFLKTTNRYAGPGASGERLGRKAQDCPVISGSGCTGRPMGAIFAPFPTPRGAWAGSNFSAVKGNTSPFSPMPVLSHPTRSSKEGPEREKETEGGESGEGGKPKCELSGPRSPTKQSSRAPRPSDPQLAATGCAHRTTAWGREQEVALILFSSEGLTAPDSWKGKPTGEKSPFWEKLPLHSLIQFPPPSPGFTGHCQVGGCLCPGFLHRKRLHSCPPSRKRPAAGGRLGEAALGRGSVRAPSGWILGPD